MVRLVLVLLLLLPVAVRAAAWDIARDETRVEVDVGYLSGKVTLVFPEVNGTVQFDERRPSAARADISVPVAPVESGLGIVNGLVKSRDYLDAANHPEIHFTLDRLEQTSDQTADIYGRMTLLGVTRPILFRAKVFRYGPANSDPSRFEAGFDLTGQVDRRTFGNTSGLPQVAAVLPVRIHLLMRSR